MQIDKRVELRRQIVHILIGLVILFLVFMIDKTIILWLLLVALAVTLILGFIQKKYRIFNIFSQTIGGRKEFPFRGLIFFLIGSLLVVKLFELDIALTAITVLTFGDSVATFFRTFFGSKDKNYTHTKYFLGSIMGVVVAFLIALVFIQPLYALTGAIVGMFAEIITIKLGETEADDNFIVPLAAGTAIYLMKILLL
ncbi:MAG: hypothetical protein ABH817_01840 [archaeon]